MKSKFLLFGASIALIVILLAACAPAPSATPCPEASPCPECPTCPTVEPLPESSVKEVPNEDEWVNSPHNDAEAEAFNHWNEEDPAEVPAACATCHSTQGYTEYTDSGKVGAGIPAPAGTIQCVACHNEVTEAMDSVSFTQKEVKEEGSEPEKVVITGLGSEVRCMVCHQGRGSTSSVNETLARFEADTDLDTVPAPQDEATLGFINIHYFPAAATLYGTQVKGGYQYEGKRYDAKTDHVEGYSTCVGCHNSHSLELKVEECKVCHTNVTSKEDLVNIRMKGSAVDYDGDGDTTEGINGELDGLRSVLYQNIQAYANEVAGTPLVYSPDAYPYFFIDTNTDGQLSEDEAQFPNSYKAWTGRLVKAAYNYQMSVKDPGAYAHGGKYIIELLYDSVEDLNQKVSNPVDMANMHRIDSGHFAGSEEAFRHWDGEGGEVPGDCAKCHSAIGLPTFLKEAAAQRDLVSGRNVAAPAANGQNCATCHQDLSTFTLRTVNSVKFPSGKVVSFGEENKANVCMLCHQGRESKVSVDGAIKGSGVGDDEVSEKLSFRNPHYFAAGATLWGTDVTGAYEYAEKQYNGRNMHIQGFQTCNECHDAHALSVKAASCVTCHPEASEGFEAIRKSTVDFDGNGDTTEGISNEVEALTEALYAAIQQYTVDKGLPSIVYDPGRYPYYFGDTNANGEVDGEEGAFASWTPRLLRAAYNYQWVNKDPGAFAHNPGYILQILFDSLEDLGADVGNFTRPEVKAPVQ